MTAFSALRPMAAIFLFALALCLPWSAGAEGKARFVIKFKPGAITPLDDEQIKKAAALALDKGTLMQVEGFSCAEDGDGGGKTGHRLAQGEKRAEEVRSRMLKYGVPADSVITIAYDHGECSAVVSAY